MARSKKPPGCCECSKPATWIRHTQFAGSHPFCTAHAKAETDFGTSSSYLDWEELLHENQHESD